MSSEAHSSPSPPGSHGDGAAAPAMPEGGLSGLRAGDEALAYIAQFESRLTELRTSAQAASARASALDERERDLRRREQEHQAAGATRAAGENDRAALDQREETLRVLAQRLLNSEERLVSMEAELTRTRERLALASAAAATAGDGGVALEGESESGALALRRVRLGRYKSLLNALARKLMAARAALQKKNGECESVLAQRAKLAQAAGELAAQRSILAQRAAKSHAAALTFFLTATVAVILGLGWAIATQVNPATYAARTVLAAEAGENEPSKDDLSAWTSAHERLLEDPELMTLAADRFAARGIDYLASPPSVSAKFKVGQDFAYMTDRVGALTLELRGQGAEATARELETFALAAVALANARRDARGDGLPTMVAEAPKAGTEPLSDGRWMYVATITAPGLLAAGGIGFGLYRLLIRGKRRFERHMAVVEATA